MSANSSVPISLGVDVAWADGVHSDLLRGQLAGHAARHLEDRRLRGIVWHPFVSLEQMQFE